MGAALLTGDGDLLAADGGVVGVGVVAVLGRRKGDNRVALASGGAAGTEAGAVVGKVTGKGDGGGGNEANGGDNLSEGKHFYCPFVSYGDGWI